MIAVSYISKDDFVVVSPWWSVSSKLFFPPSLFDLITIFPAGGSFSQVSGNLYSVLSIKRTKKLLKVLFMVGLAACEFHCRVI